MIRVHPIASPLHDEAEVLRVVHEITSRLEHGEVAHRLVEAGEVAARGGPLALLVLTGGTERHVLQLVASPSLGDMPTVLLAHTDHNSLPACMEILARLQQDGRRGTIVLLGGDETGSDPYEELRRIDTVLTARERLASCRLGRIGAPSDWLVASAPEPEVAREAWGVEVKEIAMAELVREILEADEAEADRITGDFVARAARTMEPTLDDLRQAARVAAALRRVVERHGLDGLALRCFDLVRSQRTTGCLALSRLIDDGIIAGCEGDLPAALTMLWLHELTGELPFMANPQQIDRDQNTIWLSHCTIARGLVERYALRSHFESSIGVALEGEVRPGPVTLARLGGRDLRRLFVSEGELLGSGRSPRRCRTQLELQLEEEVETFLRRPLGNHHVLIRGHWAELLLSYHRLCVAPAQ